MSGFDKEYPPVVYLRSFGDGYIVGPLSVKKEQEELQGCRQNENKY